jgi:hypothetical protein
MPWTRITTFASSATFDISTHANANVTLGSAVSVGNVILLMTTVAAQPSTLTSTMTDQLGNTYTRLSGAQGGQFWDATQTQGLDGWICVVTTAGTPTITYTPDSTARAWIAMKGSAFSGATTATLRDSKSSNQAIPGTGANAITTASLAAQSGDLLWGASFADSTTFSTIASGTGFTTSTVDSVSGMLDEWETASGAAAVTFTDATHGGTETYLTLAIAVSPSAIATAAITGTATASILESDIVTGGKTIIITLTGDTWILN